MRAPRHVALRPREDKALVGARARAFRWLKKLDNGVAATLVDQPRAKGGRASYERRVLRLTLLAPDMVEPIIGRRQPALVWPLSKSSRVPWSNVFSWLG